MIAQTTSDRPPYGLRKTIEAVKEAVPIEQVAAEYTSLRYVGAGRHEGRCPFPDHDDSTPSFHVYADVEEPHFHCYGCGMHGDVLDLEELAGRHGEVWSAVVALSVRYAVDLPERSPRWFDRQDEKAKIREEMRRRLAKVYQRRYYRMFRDPGAHPEDDAALWEELYKPAYLAATKRVFG